MTNLLHVLGVGTVKRLAFLGCLGFFLSPFALTAQQLTGSTLLEACETNSPETQAFCLGWIMGLNEGLSFGAFQGLTDERLAEIDPLDGLAGAYAGFCIPTTITYDAMAAILMDALRDSQDLREGTARAAFHGLMGDTFPCQN